jgi:uncharacterized damage-inducible protein DinB
MAETVKREVWQRGPVNGVPALLQPVAHALLQAKEEVINSVKDFPSEQLWNRPGGVASVGFHLQHLTGVIDRLFTYASGGTLNAVQLEQLSAEGKEDVELTVLLLVTAFERQVAHAIDQLTATDERSLTEERLLGRAGIPTTVGGLLFHAAEHTMRHVGQLLVTVKMIRANIGSEEHQPYTQGH